MHGELRTQARTAGRGLSWCEHSDLGHIEVGDEIFENRFRTAAFAKSWALYRTSSIWKRF